MQASTYAGGQPQKLLTSQNPFERETALQASAEDGLYPVRSFGAVLAFNVHAQFANVGRNGGFGGVGDVMRERDRSIEGDVNPYLADFSDHTEARQYSGRAMEDQWRWPVQSD